MVSRGQIAPFTEGEREKALYNKQLKGSNILNSSIIFYFISFGHIIFAFFYNVSLKKLKNICYEIYLIHRLIFSDFKPEYPTFFCNSHIDLFFFDVAFSFFFLVIHNTEHGKYPRES